MDATEIFMEMDDITLGVLPSGTLGLFAVPPTESGNKFSNARQTLSRELVDAFSDSAAAGLTWLASSDRHTGLSSTPEFWRDFSRRYFRSLCRQSSQSSRGWLSPQSPGDEVLSEVLQSAPPMVGLEYLSNDSLTKLWNELDQHTRRQVAAPSGGKNGKKGRPDIATYLRDLDPDWNLVGRVTFHLAENKKNESKPFAFLATYTDDRSKSRSPQHIPLADALKQ